MESAIAKAHRKDSVRALSRLCHQVNGVPRIISDPPLLVPVEDLKDQHHIDQLQRLLAAYRATLDGDRAVLAGRYRYTHAARKVVAESGAVWPIVR